MAYYTALSFYVFVLEQEYKWSWRCKKSICTRYM